MTFDEFRQSLTAIEPPAGLSHALAGLWWDAKGDWKRAHESAQQDEPSRVRGFTLISIEKKATVTTPRIGIGGQLSLFAASCSMRNGLA